MPAGRGTHCLVGFRDGNQWLWAGPDYDGEIPRRILSAERDGLIERVILIESVERAIAFRLAGPVLKILQAGRTPQSGWL